MDTNDIIEPNIYPVTNLTPITEPKHPLNRRSFVDDQNINNADSIVIYHCPHCSINIGVKKNEIFCTIFRCGVYKSNNEQISPHSSKEVCDELVAKNLIIGCGGPFRIDNDKAVVCDYI